MSSAAKRRLKQEQLKLKRDRHSLIIESVYRLFCQKGIDNTTFQDVADDSDFGVATIYRYYSNKTEMAIQAALYNWKTGFIALAEESMKCYRGGDQICSLFNGYIRLFITKPEVYRFMVDFDNYISRLNNSPSTMSQYDELLKHYNSLIADMISQGVRDEILKSKENMNQYYSMIFNAIVAFAQKLLNRRTMDNRDKLWKDAEQMTLLVETLISNIMTVKGIIHYEKFKATGV